MAVQKTNTQNLSSLIINKVDSKDTFQSMVTNNLVNANELYLVQSELEESSEVFRVSIETDAETGTNGIIQSYSDIITALDNGYFVYGYHSDQGYFICTPDRSNHKIIFYQLVYDNINDETYIHFYSIDSNDFCDEGGSNITNSSNATLTIGSYTYDGSSAVNIPVYDGTYTWG